MEYLGAESRGLIQTVKDLEKLDINTTLQLPKFVVVGDQSAGKSSIVEALCDISLPRSQGTCTR
jgi:GTPase SAR1 family protein